VHARWLTEDAAEDLAALLLATALRVPVMVHDKRCGLGTYDLEICHADGRRGAVEVGCTTQLGAMHLRQVEMYAVHEGVRVDDPHFISTCVAFTPTVTCSALAAMTGKKCMSRACRGS
jgi:hypothetical protein